MLRKSSRPSKGAQQVKVLATEPGDLSSAVGSTWQWVMLLQHRFDWKEPCGEQSYSVGKQRAQLLLPS